MVIECTECQTRFRMADDKLKPGGIKVRCTKCKQIFTVHPPAETEETPSEATEWGGGAPADSAPADNAPADSAQADASGGDFSFDEPPATDFAADQPLPEREDDFGDSGFSADYSFDLEGDTPAEEESFTLGAPPAADEAEETGGSFSLGDGEQDNTFGFGEADGEQDTTFGFGDVDGEETAFGFDDGAQDANLGFDDGPAIPPLSMAFVEEKQDLSQDAGAGLALTGGSDDSVADSGDFGFSLEAADDFSWQGQQQADESPDDDVVDDDFDLSKMTFGDDDHQAEEDNSTHSAPPFSPPRTDSFAPPPSADGSKTPVADEPFHQNDFPMEPAQRSFPWAALLLLPLLVLGGGAGYFYWIDGAIDLDRIIARLTGNQLQTAPLGQVRLTELNGGFVEHAQLGQLFVVHGKTVNEFQETRSAISVKGILYNGGGKALLQQTAFAGNPLAEPALRTLPLEKIEEHMNNQFGDSLSNLNVAPGKSIPFTIVFKNLPADLAEFTVEVVDSKPVAK